MESKQANGEGTVSLKGKIITGSGIENGFITISNGVIVGTGIHNPPSEVIDVGDSYIAPGYIDMHIHGIHTFLVNNGHDDLCRITQILPQYGVTGFLPTLIPCPAGEDIALLEKLSAAKTGGTQILGFHLEGPFLKITGALTSDAISKAETGRVKMLKQAAKPYKVIFSISPEVEGIDSLIPVMTEDQVPAFITHTMATVQQTRAAIELGARHATHFYDVFPCPAVTEPGVRPCGVVEAVLADERVGVDFILDGVHVDPVAVKMALACKSKGQGKVCLITDSNVGAGLGPGKFVFCTSGEIEFAYKGSPARLVKDNTLAGSGLTMDQALRNAVKWLDLSLPEAVKLVSTNPAEAIGMGHCKGKLLPGYDADLVILDKQYNVVQTWVGGKCCYKVRE